ncbi:MAG: sensor histidine kinase [Myxococcota bacterium]
MTVQFDDQTQRWRVFAAYATWAALAILAAVIAANDTGLSSLRRGFGVGAVVSTIGLGLLHLRVLGPDRRPLNRQPRLWLATGTALLSVWALGEQTFAVFLVIIAGSASETGDRRATWYWLAVANVGLLTGFALLLSPMQLIVSFPLFLGFQLFSVAMNSALGRERELRETLAGVNAELLATRRLLQESARSQERLRISRELHDVAGHRLTALKLNLRAELDRSEPDRDRIGLCFDLSDELLGDIRSVVHELRVADKIDVPGALELLKGQHPDLEIELNVARPLRVDEIEVAEAILRSTQEAITNALKHGRARKVHIALANNSTGVCLNIQDDGTGGTLRNGGHGLDGMRERAELLGGRLEVESSVGRGWTLRLFIPQAVAA